MLTCHKAVLIQCAGTGQQGFDIPFHIKEINVCGAFSPTLRLAAAGSSEGQCRNLS